MVVTGVRLGPWSTSKVGVVTSIPSATASIESASFAQGRRPEATGSSLSHGEEGYPTENDHKDGSRELAINQEFTG